MERNGILVRLVLTSNLLLTAILLLGCTNKEIPDNETLVVAIGAGPKTLDPRFATDAIGQRINGLLFNGLVRIGPNLELVGDLAESFEYKDNVYTFKLRPKISFSNGRELTAEDIQYSFDFFRGPKSPYQATLASIQAVETDFEATPRIVRVKLSSFSAFLLSEFFAIKIMPKDLMANGIDGSIAHLIGTGPYMLVESNPNQILLKARNDHPYMKPQIPNVIFKIIQDDSTRYLKAIKGGVDLIQSDMPLSKIVDFEKSKDFEAHKYTGISMDYMLFNLRDPLLKNKDVRLIFASTINRDEVIKYKLNGLATPAVSIVSPGQTYFNSSLTNPAFDLQKAKAIVEKYKLGGKEFVLKTSNNPEAIEKGKVLANQFEKAGIKIKLQSFEWATYYGDIARGNFQLATMRWTGVMDPDINRIALHSSQIPKADSLDKVGRNRGAYSNPSLDQLLDQGPKIEELEKRIAHYKNLQQIISDDLPILPLWHETQVALVHRRVKNYQPAKNGDFSPIFRISK